MSRQVARLSQLLLARAAAAPPPAAAAAAAACSSSLLLLPLQHLEAGTWISGVEHHQRRQLSTSRSQCMSTALAGILKEEVQHEKSAYAKPEAIARGPPAPFTLSEAPGDTMLTLTRSFGGGEQISVDLHVNNQPAAPEGAADAAASDGPIDEEQLSTVLFNVHVTKGDTSLVFECESDGLFVAINHLSHEPKGGVTSESTYTGPVFDELDGALQEEFRTYLAERGITPELGEYLRHLVFDKEVREYMDWLQRVHDFVAPASK